MKITFYNNHSDAKCVNKNIEELATIEGRLVEEISVFSPTIMLTEKIPPNANYAYIEEIERYYYIDSITVQYNGLPRITFFCDVLMTFKKEILESIGHFSKNTNYNPYAVDYDVSDKKDISTLEFADFTFPAFPTMVLVTTKANYNDWYHGSLGGM